MIDDSIVVACGYSYKTNPYVIAIGQATLFTLVALEQRMRNTVHAFMVGTPDHVYPFFSSAKANNII
jgi:hypothetical protein